MEDDHLSIAAIILEVHPTSIQRVPSVRHACSSSRPLVTMVLPFALSRFKSEAHSPGLISPEPPHPVTLIGVGPGLCDFAEVRLEV